MVHEIDLSSLAEQGRQRNNAAEFQNRKIRLLFGLGSVVLLIIIGKYSVPAYQKVLIGIIFVTMVVTVFLLLACKCPNCGAIPAGESLSLSSEIRYTKGVNPFAKRCRCCGFYLSQKYLEQRIREANTMRSP
jgi:hypothetical protein